MEMEKPIGAGCWALGACLGETNVLLLLGCLQRPRLAAVPAASHTGAAGQQYLASVRELPILEGFSSVSNMYLFKHKCIYIIWCLYFPHL